MTRKSRTPPVDKAYTKFSSVVGARGWRITIHERDTLPALFERGFDIEPGISTSISLTSPEISRLPHPYTDCVQDETVDNTNYIIATSFCHKKCMFRIIDGACGCIPADLVDYHHPDIKYCLALNISDPFETFKRQFCQKQLRSGNTTSTINQEVTACETKCRWHCKETEYTLQSSTSIFPTKEVMSYFFTINLYENPDREELFAWKYFLIHIKDTNKTAKDYTFQKPLQVTEGKDRVTEQMASWIRKHFARVNIYFENVNMYQKKQTAAYGVWDLFADVGGILGLWVGISVLTVTEFCVFFCKLLKISVLCSPMTMKNKNNKEGGSKGSPGTRPPDHETKVFTTT